METLKKLLREESVYQLPDELKLSMIKGGAKERFLGLIQNRPEIMACVPLKVIATYLGGHSSIPQPIAERLLRKEVEFVSIYFPATAVFSFKIVTFVGNK